ncbi:YihY/virulence factor BrkB family protein [Streptosporangium sp. NBC_01755]|uniref:YihY/virulence factor BrkB family protein n=1 Tax=unclassified Streptosporangium TaxID=2632669 RepID=UPI002DDB1667|nr:MULTISPECIES: YihY/virulence factor BrkB family protein [unclassified Streptosporangium]WSA24292.1 YihY/virulence factor BrkB family protein [Streptosporangium sp. NBC_01810]WSC97634.1 YihY/virulence factor BrkB family protein [Streptosporangium sp. NBC_01755]
MERVQAGRERFRAVLNATRIRWPWFDHLVRTFHRYQIQSGDRLAGAISYFAFLSFFPIIALAFAVFGYFLSVRPNATAPLREAINQYLPGLADKLPIQEIADSRASAGVIGLLGLLYAGLGAVDALRGALREISMTTEPPLNFFLAKLRDLSALVLLGTTMVVSVLVGGFATQASGTVAGWLGLSESVVGTVTIRLVGVAVSVLADVVVFLIILRWLGRSRQPLRVLLRGALFGAVGFALLKQLAALILAHTLNNPVYGVFAVVVGLLVWINLSARVIMYAAAWTATASLGPPPSPTPIPANAIPT